MKLEKIVFSFFIILAMTLNFGFVLGGMSTLEHHSVYLLFAVIVVSLIATVLKFGDRSQVGAMMLATSLVADLQLIVAAILWAMATHVHEAGVTSATLANVVSLSAGALVAHVIAVVLLIIETSMLRR